MDKLQQLIEAYIFDMLHAGVIRDTANNKLPNEFFPDAVCMMIQEDLYGRLTSGLIGYVLAVEGDVDDLQVMSPRAVSLACLELLRPYANADRPDIADVVRRCDKANDCFKTDQAIDESGATNVTTLH